MAIEFTARFGVLIQFGKIQDNGYRLFGQMIKS